MCVYLENRAPVYANQVRIESRQQACMLFCLFSSRAFMLRKLLCFSDFMDDSA